MSESALVLPPEREERHSPMVPAVGQNLVAMAIQNRATPEMLTQLIAFQREADALQREREAHDAKKAYVSDMADFKKNPPTIIKDKSVGYNTKEGDFVGYKHASLGAVTSAVVEALGAHGFSHRWDVKQNGAMVEVTCIITHRLGHSESVALSAGKDDTGKKNAIQQMASAATYLSRYSLLMACGLAAQDQVDDDGASSEEPPKVDYLAGQELEDFKERVKRSIASVPKFLSFLKIESLDVLPLDRFAKANNAVIEREKFIAAKAKKEEEKTA